MCIHLAATDEAGAVLHLLCARVRESCFPVLDWEVGPRRLRSKAGCCGSLACDESAPETHNFLSGRCGLTRAHRFHLLQNAHLECFCVLDAARRGGPSSGSRLLRLEANRKEHDCRFT